MMYEAIRYEQADGVATITLHRPEVHNAMNERMREELTRCFDAREALRIGLVERVVPTGEVLPAAQALARTLADKAPVALRYAKEAVVKGLGLPLEDGIRLENDLATLLRTTEDRIEGAKAFLEKRKPLFSGT